MWVGTSADVGRHGCGYWCRCQYLPFVANLLPYAISPRVTDDRIRRILVKQIPNAFDGRLIVWL